MLTAYDQAFFFFLASRTMPASQANFSKTCLNTKITPLLRCFSSLMDWLHPKHHGKTDNSIHFDMGFRIKMDTLDMRVLTYKAVA